MSLLLWMHCLKCGICLDGFCNHFSGQSTKMMSHIHQHENSFHPQSKSAVPKGAQHQARSRCARQEASKRHKIFSSLLPHKGSYSEEIRVMAAARTFFWPVVLQSLTALWKFVKPSCCPLRDCLAERRRRSFVRPCFCLL